MFTLRISHDWASQVQTIRDATTEDTHLIRHDNGFYRACRQGNENFQVHLLPGAVGGRGIQLNMREKDLYVTHVDGRPFETYAQTLDRLQPQSQSLDNAVMSLANASGAKLFEMQSVIVLCVAESLRNDQTATRIGQLIRATTTGLIGVPKRLPVAELLRDAHAWGQTSEAIYRALSPTGRDIAFQLRAQLTPAQRQHSERVDLSRIDTALQPFARSLKVLKRPG